MATSEAMAGVKKVYVLDCGGQYAHLIASRVRKYEALSVIVAADTPASELVGASMLHIAPCTFCPPLTLRRCGPQMLARSSSPAARSLCTTPSR